MLQQNKKLSIKRKIIYLICKEIITENIFQDGFYVTGEIVNAEFTKKLKITNDMFSRHLKKMRSQGILAKEYKNDSSTNGLRKVRVAKPVLEQIFRNSSALKKFATEKRFVL